MPYVEVTVPAEEGSHSSGGYTVTVNGNSTTSDYPYAVTVNKPGYPNFDVTLVQGTPRA